MASKDAKDFMDNLFGEFEKVKGELAEIKARLPEKTKPGEPAPSPTPEPENKKKGWFEELFGFGD